MMKIASFYLIVALIQPALYGMKPDIKHIQNNSTIISFNHKKKSIFEWIRDDKKKEFGRTPIIITSPNNELLFLKRNTIKNLQQEELTYITNGYAFYCKNISKKKNIVYGAIVINTNRSQFKSEIAETIYIELRNQYLGEQISKQTKKTIHKNKTDGTQQAIINNKKSTTQKASNFKLV